jgi:hypothetical protein
MRRANPYGRCTRFCFSVAPKIAAGRAITKGIAADSISRTKNAYELGNPLFVLVFAGNTKTVLDAAPVAFLGFRVAVDRRALTSNQSQNHHQHDNSPHVRPFVASSHADSTWHVVQRKAFSPRQNEPSRKNLAYYDQRDGAKTRSLMQMPSATLLTSARGILAGVAIRTNAPSADIRPIGKAAENDTRGNTFDPPQITFRTLDNSPEIVR